MLHLWESKVGLFVSLWVVISELLCVGGFLFRLRQNWCIGAYPCNHNKFNMHTVHSYITTEMASFAFEYLRTFYSGQDVPHGRVLRSKKRDPVVYYTPRGRTIRNGGPRKLHSAVALHWWWQTWTSEVVLGVWHQERLERLKSLQLKPPSLPYPLFQNKIMPFDRHNEPFEAFTTLYSILPTPFCLIVVYSECQIKISTDCLLLPIA